MSGDLARDCARVILDAFVDYNAEFGRITRRARRRFEKRDWRGMQRDTVERIELYERWVGAGRSRLASMLGEHCRDRALWNGIRSAYATLIEVLPDLEFAKTFYNSITRRLFTTVGVDPQIEFIALELDPLRRTTASVPTSVYVNRGSIRYLFEELLGDFSFAVSYHDFERSIDRICLELEQAWKPLDASEAVSEVEVIKSVFYQTSRAYLIGRINAGNGTRPLAIALKNTESGIIVDAVIQTEAGASIVFSFSRSYFHVDLATVTSAVVFLKSILPRKPVSELFTVLGRAKQGKTERYRDFIRHLEGSREQLVHAPGDKGLVMIVFTLPSYDIVFKVIRDRFPPPKSLTRQDVLDRYQLVFKHDRAGRLVDAQEFRYLKFPRNRFAVPLLEELVGEASQSVTLDGEDLIIRHSYVERRLTPLNLYLRGAPSAAAEWVVLDYGQAIRDLAATNIFPGDLLLKNFGVTRHGRVIFYDYDELCLVTDCRFRELPQPSTLEDEMRAEPWFYVAENDVFPEQFVTFLGFGESQLELFMKIHGEILTADYWREIKRQHLAGELLEVLPYHPRREA